MNAHEDLDRDIDAYLKDDSSQPSVDFTAKTLDRIALDKEDRSGATEQSRWWFLLPIAAAIIMAFALSRDEVTSSDKGPQVADSSVKKNEMGLIAQSPAVDMDEILIMEESLRDFEILFDDEALDILALLEE